MNPFAAADKASIENPNYASEIISLSCGSDSLNLNAKTFNNTEHNIIGKCSAAIYDKSNKLKAIVIKDFTVSPNSNASTDLQFKNYTYSDSDFVTLFVWDNDAMKPFTRTVSMPVQNS